MDLDTLAATVRRKLADGTLPRAEGAKLYGGYGRDHACSACEQTIQPAQVEYECNVGDRVYRFHSGCYAVWRAERERLP